MFWLRLEPRHAFALKNSPPGRRRSQEETIDAGGESAYGRG
jgi:hypothetical protein